MEPLRFRVRRPVQIGKRVLFPGKYSLAQVFPYLQTLISLGVLEELPVDMDFSGYVLVLSPCLWGQPGEVIAAEDIPVLGSWIARNVLLLLYPPELNSVFKCEKCGKQFYSRTLIAQHKDKTGHRRKYSRRESLAQSEGEHTESGRS